MNFLDFPKINNNQYALLICRSNTGHILDENLNRYKETESNNIYFIFDNLENAYQFIEARKRANVDFEIFDTNRKSIEIISIPPEPDTDKKGWWKNIF
jgi:hypothetical protein